MSILNNNVKFFLPVDIEKGVDKKGATVYKIKGRATTQSEDSAGETLKVSGFDTSELKTINWNHKSKDNAEAYLGEPTKVEGGVVCARL